MNIITTRVNKFDIQRKGIKYLLDYITPPHPHLNVQGYAFLIGCFLRGKNAEVKQVIKTIMNMSYVDITLEKRNYNCIIIKTLLICVKLITSYNQFPNSRAIEYFCIFHGRGIYNECSTFVRNIGIYRKVYTKCLYLIEKSIRMADVSHMFIYTWTDVSHMFIDIWVSEPSVYFLT